MILVDTNVWSELAKPHGNPAVLAWLEANDADLALSTLVIAEIHFGIHLLSDEPKRKFLESWVAGLEARFWGQTIRFGRKSAHNYGQIAAHPEVKTRQPQIIDMQIAAQAKEHGIPLATRNVKDFAWTGVELVNPWDA